jgi:hypothetical protein
MQVDFHRISTPYARGLHLAAAYMSSSQSEHVRYWHRLEGMIMRRSAIAGVVLAAGIGAAVLTASASAATSGGTTLRLTATATATVLVSPCDTCVTSVPAGVQAGVVADQYGDLVNGQGARVGHYVFVATEVTPQGELLLDVTLVLGQGQITAHGIEEPPADSGTIAITGGTGLYQSAGGEIRFRDTSQTATLLQVVIGQ